MKYERRARRRFAAQKTAAWKRGIAFEFTFPEWVAWWEKHLGDDWLQLRGLYVMARWYDDGPYAAHNVKCILARENSAEV
jgi:hypothetical protein